MWKAFLKGVASIGEGWATFTLWPSPIKHRPFKLRGFEDDAKALQSDWSSIRPIDIQARIKELQR